MQLDKETLQVVPLGGLGEIGKNMTAVRQASGMILVDAGSRNKTILNGLAIPLQSPEETNSGDAIRFGAVEAILSSASVVWLALRG